MNHIMNLFLMKCVLVWWLLYCCNINGVHSSSSSSSSHILYPTVLQQKNDTEFAMVETLALMNALNWVQHHYTQADVNILYALRVAEGALPHTVVKDIATTLMPFAKMNDPTYSPLEDLVNHAHIVNDARLVPLDSKNIIAGLPQHTNPNYDVFGSNFNEHFSDQCVHGALKCDVPQKCMDRLGTDDPMGGYALTHKMLFFYLLQRKHCVKVISKNENERMFERQVVAMWREQLDDQNYSDLSTERVGLGGMLGFTSFLQTKWIRNIIRHQLDSGCWPAQAHTTTCDMHATAVSIIPLAVHLHFTKNARPFEKMTSAAGLKGG